MSWPLLFSTKYQNPFFPVVTECQVWLDSCCTQKHSCLVLYMFILNREMYNIYMCITKNEQFNERAQGCSWQGMKLSTASLEGSMTQLQEGSDLQISFLIMGLILAISTLSLLISVGFESIWYQTFHQSQVFPRCKDMQFWKARLWHRLEVWCQE